MIVIGVDIGYDRCGIAVYEIRQNKPVLIDAILIETDKKLEFKDRLGQLFSYLSEVKERFVPDILVVEKLFFYRKNTIFEKICMSKGVLYSVFSKQNIIEVEPRKVKKFFTGNGMAKKSDMKYIMEKFIGDKLLKKNDDVIDAIALALYGTSVI